MAIKALSDSTIHLLGSSQVLTTPTSLIKELIDNALDAKATSVDILISQNTIDKVEVRDNGHGIQPEDLDALGKRGHTSKLTTFAELKNLGGKSLGFRGEALASACQLGDVSITTKSDGQPVATCVKLKTSGGIQSHSRTSHPIGTTVCVMNFMSKLPVRKQTALKEAPKTIGRIQELVQRYSLARLSVKFTLKIVKGTKSAWSYAPRPHGTVKDAVSLVIGREASLQCSEASLSIPEIPSLRDACEGTDAPINVNLADEVMTSHFRLEAFMPRYDADLSKIGSGQYLSVDSRPVASEKGTMKKVTTIFKSYVRNGLVESSPEKIKNPFLRLNIVCPEASYDQNVEPAKDDILFENEMLVLEAAEQMFKNFYGARGVVMAQPAKNNTKTNPDGFDVLLARKPRQNPSISQPIFEPPEDTPPTTCPSSEVASNICSTNTSKVSRLVESEDHELIEDLSTPRKRKWGRDMSRDYTEYTDELCPRDFTNRAQNRSNLASSRQPALPDLNPCVIAKLTAPIQNSIAPESCTTNGVLSSGILLKPIENAPLRVALPQSVVIAPSPQQHGYVESNNTDMAEILKSHSDFRRHIHSSPTLPVEPSDSTTQDDLPETYNRKNNPKKHGFITAANFADNSLMSPPSTSPNVHIQSQKRSRGINKPFVTPFRTTNSSDVSAGRVQKQLPFPYQPFQVQREARQIPPTTLTRAPEAQALNPELQWAMDFEHRKENATRRRRDELQAMRDLFQQPPATSRDPSQSSPHKNRYNAALASLETSGQSTRDLSSEVNSKGFETSLPDGDPRGYFIRRQKSFSVSHSITSGPRKLKRAQTLRLPLESIHENTQTHRLLQTVPSDLDEISKLVVESSKQDMYVRRGMQTLGLEMTTTDRYDVGQKLYQVVESWMNSGRGEKCDVDFVFHGLGSLSGA